MLVKSGETSKYAQKLCSNFILLMLALPRSRLAISNPIFRSFRSIRHHRNQPSPLLRVALLNSHKSRFAHSARTMSSLPGENFEPRQTSTTDDYSPHPSQSIKLEPNRQRLVDDILALYSCQPTIERVKRYTPDCVYDDQFVYANDRFKMAGQW